MKKYYKNMKDFHSRHMRVNIVIDHVFPSKLEKTTFNNHPVLGKLTILR